MASALPIPHSVRLRLVVCLLLKGAKVGAVEVRAGVADNIKVTGILEWGLDLLALDRLKATGTDLYFGRT
jgi:hypothetical protein